MSLSAMRTTHKGFLPCVSMDVLTTSLLVVASVPTTAHSMPVFSSSNDFTQFDEVDEVDKRAGDSSNKQRQHPIAIANLVSPVHKLGLTMALQSTSLLSSFLRVLAVTHPRGHIVLDAQNATDTVTMSRLLNALHAQEHNVSLERDATVLRLDNAKVKKQIAQLEAALMRVAATSVFRIAIDNHSTKVFTRQHQQLAGDNLHRSTALHQHIKAGLQFLVIKNQALADTRMTGTTLTSIADELKRHLHTMVANCVQQIALRNVGVDKNSMKRPRLSGSKGVMPIIASSGPTMHPRHMYNSARVPKSRTSPRAHCASRVDELDTVFNRVARTRTVNKPTRITLSSHAMATHRVWKRGLNETSTAKKTSFVCTTKLVKSLGVASRYPTLRVSCSADSRHPLCAYEDYEIARLENSTPRTLTCL